MTHTIHVFTATRRARAALTGTALPQVAITHLAGITLAFAFVGEDGETIGALGGTSSARCVVKALPTSDVLLLDSGQYRYGPVAHTLTADAIAQVWQVACTPVPAPDGVLQYLFSSD